MRKLSGKETALPVATACSDPPQGRKRWTLDLLADAMVGQSMIAYRARPCADGPRMS